MGADSVSIKDLLTVESSPLTLMLWASGKYYVLPSDSDPEAAGLA
ncbi:hypothetical protein [Acidilobus sp.]|jgi:hypothetical protein